MRRNPAVSPVTLASWISDHSYLTDQSIAETEGGGEEEEGDERSSPACLVDDARHQPARHLARQGKCRLTCSSCCYFVTSTRAPRR